MSQTRPYPPIINVTAATFAALPPSYIDGALGTVRDTDTVYMFDVTSGVWVVANASAVLTPASVGDTATVDLTVTLGVLTADVVAASIGTAQLTDAGVTDAKVATGIDAAKLADGSVSNTEFQRLDGVTSGIQAQLDGKQATGSYITALTGDVAASGPGSAAATLATVNAGVGAFGSASQSPQFTVNGKGLITASANVTITPAAIGAQPVDAFLTSLAALTGSGLVMASATDTGVMRSLAVSGDAAAIAVTNPAGVAGNPTVAYADLRTANGTNPSYTAVGQTTATAAASPANLAASTVTLTGDVYELTIEVGAGSNERTAINVFAVFGSAAISAPSDPSGLFLATDAGTGIVVTKSASSAVLTIKNRMGAARTIRVKCSNTTITSATAWA